MFSIDAHHSRTVLDHIQVIMAQMQYPQRRRSSGTCHWKSYSKEANAKWTGYAAFAVAPLDDRKGVCLSIQGHEIRVDDEIQEPNTLRPEWWGHTVQDEHGMERRVSIWCTGPMEAINVASHSADNNGEPWGNRWWMIWKLTLWNDTIADLVQTGSISPTAIVVNPLMKSRQEGETHVTKTTLRAWQISRPIDMGTLEGYHQTYNGGMTMQGKCEKYLISQENVWFNVKINKNTKLTQGTCSRWEWQEQSRCRLRNTKLVNNLCSHCFNVPHIEECIEVPD